MQLGDSALWLATLMTSGAPEILRLSLIFTWPASFSTPLACAEVSREQPAELSAQPFMADRGAGDPRTCPLTEGKQYRQADDLLARIEVAERGTLGHQVRLDGCPDRLKKSASHNAQTNDWSSGRAGGARYPTQARHLQDRRRNIRLCLTICAAVACIGTMIRTMNAVLTV
jgi:hypothetical protein